MNVRNNKKLLAIALSIVIIVISVFTLSVFADTEDSPVILSYNIAYQDNFSVMVAVDARTVKEGGVILEVRFSPENENADREYYVPEPETITVEGVDYSAYVFTTEGVAAKDMADFFYFTAVDSEGNRSETLEYSVAHYMLERLYGGAEISKEQKALYESTLIFGANAQAVLAKNETPVTRLRRVVAGDKVRLLKEGEVLTLDFTLEGQTGWLATYPDGSTVTTEGTAVTVDGHMVLTPSTEAPAAPVYDSINFEAEEPGSKEALNGAGDLKFFDFSKTMETGIVADPAGGDNKVFKVKDTASGNSHIRLLFGDSMSAATNTSGNTYIFRSKLYFEAAENSGTEIFTLDLRTDGASSGYNVGFVYLNNSGTVALKSLQRLDSSKNPTLGDTSADGSFANFYTGDALKLGEWLDFEMVMTHYENGGVTYVDVSYRIGGVEFARQEGISKFSTSQIKADANSLNLKFDKNNSSTVYFDDVYLERR